MAAGRDRGSAVVEFALVSVLLSVLLLVTVVVNLSRVFLAQRALDSAADAAALAGVQAVRADPYYDEGAADDLPVAGTGAHAAVRQHLRDARASTTCDGFRLDGVEATETTVTVTVSCRVRIPYANLVAGAYADGVPITGEATARQRVRP